MKATEIQTVEDVHKWLWAGEMQLRDRVFEMSDDVVTRLRMSSRTWMDRHHLRESASDLQGRMMDLIAGAMASQGVNIKTNAKLFIIRDYVHWLETNNGAPSS